MGFPPSMTRRHGRMIRIRIHASIPGATTVRGKVPRSAARPWANRSGAAMLQPILAFLLARVHQHVGRPDQLFRGLRRLAVAARAEAESDCPAALLHRAAQLLLQVTDGGGGGLAVGL